MKLFLSVFVLLAFLASPIAFAEDAKPATATAEDAKPATATADSGSKAKNDNKAAEEEPDCD